MGIPSCRFCGQVFYEEYHVCSVNLLQSIIEQKELEIWEKNSLLDKLKNQLLEVIEKIKPTDPEVAQVLWNIAGGEYRDAYDVNTFFARMRGLNKVLVRANKLFRETMFSNKLEQLEALKKACEEVNIQYNNAPLTLTPREVIQELETYI